MAKVIQPLTNTQIEKAKPQTKLYKMFDGGGLQLRVKPSGSKIWVFEYRRPSDKTKRTSITLGHYPDISLAQARATRDEYKILTAQGVDPQDHRQKVQIEKQAEKQNTFYKVTIDWLNWNKGNIGERHAKDILRKFENHIFPSVGDLPITEIEPYHIINALKKLQREDKIPTIKKIVTHVNGVMNYAVVRRLLKVNYCINVSNEYRPKPVRHQPTIRPEELPEFMAMLNKAPLNKTTRRVILWQLLTMTRPNETATAKYEDINEAQGIWTIIINKGHIKGRKHEVTLSKQALSLLEEIKADRKGNSPYLFPSVKDPLKPYGTESSNKAMGRNGYKDRLTAHGMRSIASTYLNEKGYNGDLVEVALSHLVGNQIRQSYNRAKYIEQRREMLQDWADYVEDCSKQSCF